MGFQFTPLKTKGCEAASDKLLEYCQRTSFLHIASVVLDPRFKIHTLKDFDGHLNLLIKLKICKYLLWLEIWLAFFNNWISIKKF